MPISYFFQLATELQDIELRRTLGSPVASQRLKRPLIIDRPRCQGPKDYSDETLFFINPDFAILRNNKV